MATTPTFPGAPKNPVITIVAADTTTKKTFYTAGASGGKLAAMNIATDDTAAHDIQIWLTVSATDYLVATVSVPIGSGNTSGVVPLNVLPLLGSVIDPAGYWLLAAGAIVKVAAVVTVTAVKTVYVTGGAADF
jgi:hypothetical protein